jgi:putative membrane protein
MFPAILLAVVILVQIALGIAPKADRMTWVLENAPVWIGLVIVAFTWKKFRLSNLCLTLLAIHSVILAVGGHYTYAKVPVGDWFKDAFGLARNHYDRLGHFAQGFVPAILVRELLIRRARLPRNGWLPFLVVSVCLAFSAFYEFIEWWTALATGDAAKDFLGTQGDIWDTQWDMFMAFIGAIAAVTFLPKVHDRSVTKLSRESV